MRTQHTRGDTQSELVKEKVGPIFFPVALQTPLTNLFVFQNIQRTNLVFLPVQL